MKADSISKILKDSALRITPQRIAVLEAILMLNNHPTADNIIQYIKNAYPNIAIGTVYKILDNFVSKGLVNKVKTDSDSMRYDAVTEKHHHLYCYESDRIEDYFNEELDQYLNNYFIKRKIYNFKIEDIKLQIIGKFSDNTNK